MKANLKFNNKQFIAEVSLSNVLETNENEIHSAYIIEFIINYRMENRSIERNSSDNWGSCYI